MAAERSASAARDGGAGLEGYAASHLFDRVGEVLSMIPEEQRSAILLREYHGFTTEEIGAMSGVPTATVRTRIFYGLRAARKILHERGILEETR